MSFDDEFDSPSQNAFWATAVLELNQKDKLTTLQRDILKKKECCNEALDVVEDDPPSQEVTWNEKRTYHFSETDPVRQHHSLSYSDDGSDDGVVKFNSYPVQGPATPAPQIGIDKHRRKKQRRRGNLASINDDTTETSTFCENVISQILVEGKQKKDVLKNITPQMDIGKPKKKNFNLTGILNPPIEEGRAEVLFRQSAFAEVLDPKKNRETNAISISKGDIAKKRLQAIEKRNLKLSEARSWNLNDVTEPRRPVQTITSKCKARTKIPAWFFDDFE